MNEVDVIRGAREILSDPQRWTKRTWWCGQQTCLEGALGQAACNDAYAMLREEVPKDLWSAAELMLMHVSNASNLATFNDRADTTHADILNLLDKTLADLGAL